MSDEESVWEKSVMLAFRDCQWIHRKGPMVPRSTIALDYKFERAGDALMPLSDRYFIFELKGGLEKIKSEWETREIDGVKQAAKAAYRALDNLTDVLMAKPSRAARLAVTLSMRGHFFAYWASGEPPRADQLGTLSVLSYLWAISSFKPWPEVKDILSQRYQYCVPLEEQKAGQDGAYESISHFHLPNVILDQVALVDVKSKPSAKAHQLGLQPAELDAYIRLLLASVADDDLAINVMIANGDGTFCRRVTKLSELRDIFEPTGGPGVSHAIPPLNRSGRKILVGRRGHGGPGGGGLRRS